MDLPDSLRAACLPSECVARLRHLLCAADVRDRLRHAQEALVSEGLKTIVTRAGGQAPATSCASPWPLADCVLWPTPDRKPVAFAHARARSGLGRSLSTENRFAFAMDARGFCSFRFRSRFSCCSTR